MTLTLSALLFLQLVLLIQWTWTSATVSPTDLLNAPNIEKGRQQMTSLISNSKLPHYGECWISALDNLQNGCKSLTESTQSRLAYNFASCFNEMMGFPPYLCPPDSDVKECIRKLDQNGINTFRDYFLHTQDMCYYLQYQIWNQQTMNTIDNLQQEAMKMKEQLEEANHMQEKMQANQEKTAESQEKLLKENGALFNMIVGIKDVFNEFRHSANEHRMIFIEIFEKLTKMQQLVGWIQGQMSLFDMLIFYCISTVFAFIITATPRSRNARFYLVLLFMGTLYVERQQTINEDFTPEQVLEKVWFYRSVAIVLGLIIILACAMSYRDYHVLNNTILADLSNRMDMLMNELSFDKECLRFRQDRPVAILERKPFNSTKYLKFDDENQDGTISQSETTETETNEETSDEEEEELDVDLDGSLVFRSKLRSFNKTN